MKARNSVCSILLASLVSLIAIACNARSKGPTKISVDYDFIVAIYQTTETEGVVDTISPCLLEETVNISELLHFPNDEGVTMPFNLSHTIKWAEITESNLDKRIAISVNGEVVSTPVVKMKLTNGACSVVLNDAQMAAFFPNVNIKELQSTNN